jgi:phage major head subunit gpT-like protein
MTAYTGGAMQLAGWRYPVVVDLAGLRVPKKSRPILKDHDARQIVGHTDEIAVAERSLEVAGVISGTGAVAQEIIATSENGFPWQASLGAIAEKVVFITEGKTATANGREFTGPVYIARRSMLGEVSFVALGADDETFARVAAGAGAGTDNKVEVTTMEFEQWVADCGFEIESMDEANVASLKAMFQKQQQPAEPAEPAEAPQKPDDPPPDPTAEMRAQAAAESRRIAAIRKVCNGQHADAEAKAIEEGWDETKTELAVLRASRPAAPSIVSTRNEAPSADVLEAAVCMAGKLPGLEDRFSDQVLQSAQDRFQGRIGLQELLLEAAWANGYNGRSFKSNMRVVLEAAFSTFSLPGILSNTANKFLLQAFSAVESNWRAIAAIRPVTDFKQVTSYRLVADLMYEEVGADGELKHGKVSEEEFKNQAKTYGKLLSITRTDLINDDLGALTAVPSQLGRGAGLKLNDIFWRAFLDNATFFSLANKNYAEGADTAIGIDGLTKAEQLFLDQTGPDGYPLAIMPEILLVPNALYATAQQLMNSTEIREDGNGSPRKYPTNNPHAGKFRVHRSSYLSNTLYTGNSTKAWYLLAEPANLPVIEVAFLNGQESPTVESAEADFKNLGIQLRGFHDFGCARQNHRGGVKMKGEV